MREIQKIRVGITRNGIEMWVRRISIEMNHCRKITGIRMAMQGIKVEI